jgi:putative intracellular protease/amidase/YHS domain-containing protein
MNRRELLQRTAGWTVLAAAGARADLKAPEKPINVAFLISDGAVIIDFCGPWEVFQDADVLGRHEDPFALYTVAETRQPIRASGGMQIVPDYDLASAPAPGVIVIPAQRTRSEAVKQWIRSAHAHADLTMSVCTGAFLLAGTGLLKGRSATTHHSSYSLLAMQFPDVQVRRGKRYVEDGKLATAGGLSSGIDLALRVVERYYGRDAARRTAYGMEYQGQGWLDPDSNSAYLTQVTPAAGNALCPVCGMEVAKDGAPQAVHAGRHYWFCSQEHEKAFEASPASFTP